MTTSHEDRLKLGGLPHLGTQDHHAESSAGRSYESEKAEQQHGATSILSLDQDRIHGSPMSPDETERRRRDERKRRDADERVDEEENSTGWTEENELVEKMWSIHWNLNSASDVDKLVSAWKGTAEGILIFTGLFSATVATFIIESYKSLLPSSSDSAVLAELAVQRSLLSQSLGLDVPPSTSPQTLNTRPPESALRLNTLWLFSLCISISCALGAVIMQQWARRFDRICGQGLEEEQSLGTESRLRLRLIYSITRHQVPMLINSIMAMLHVAVFLFFAGLMEFFWPINRTVALAILVLQSVFGLLYLLFTVTPIVAEVSVIQTPLTSVIWKLIGAMTAIWLSTKALVRPQQKVEDPSEDKSVNAPSRASIMPTTVWGRLKKAIKDSPNRFLHDYRHAAEYSFARGISVPATDAEIKGLVSTFEILRVKNIESYQASLPDFCAFLVGVCSYLSPEGSVEAEKIAGRVLKSPSISRPALFSTWESWLIYILTNCTSDKHSMQLTALCMRMHWFMLLHYRCDGVPSVFDRLDGLDFCDLKLCEILEWLQQRHPKLSVAIAARCLRACLAADLPSSRFHSDRDLCWQFVRAPEQLNIATFDLPHSPGDRSLIIIMGLVHDMGEIEDKRTLTNREAREVVLKQRARVLSAVIESMAEKIRDDPPYSMISDRFADFCQDFQAVHQELGIESALNDILACLGRGRLPRLNDASLPTSPVLASDDGAALDPLAAFQEVVDKVIQTLRWKRGATTGDEGRTTVADIDAREDTPSKAEVEV